MRSGILDLQTSVRIVECLLVYTTLASGETGLAWVGISIAISQLIRGNIRRLPYAKGWIVLRWVGHYVPMLVPSFVVWSHHTTSRSSTSTSVLIGMTFAFCILAYNAYKFRAFVASPATLALLYNGTPTRFEATWSIVSAASAAFSEEMFFRSFMFSVIDDPGKYLLVSTATFMSAHLLTKDDLTRFKPIDIALQGMIGILTASIMIYTGSVLGPIIIHLAYNLIAAGPAIVVLINPMDEEPNDKNCAEI